jgi:hypothetical protein
MGVNVAMMEEIRNAYIILAGKPKKGRDHLRYTGIDGE